MNVFLTVAEEAPVIEKVWNLVDWAITKFGLPVNASIAANIAGALFCMVIPYLLGSISPAILISTRVCGQDVRQVGRKSGGTYNMLISYGPKMAAMSAACEFLLGYAAIWVGRIIWETNGAGLALFFVVFGNLFPAFHKLSGGKGILTMLGSAAALSPVIFLLMMFVFALSLVTSKLVTFASVAIAGLFPIFVKAFANDGLQLAMAVFAAGFIIWAHRHNYRRVQEGQEEKFYISAYLKKKKAEDADDE